MGDNGKGLGSELKRGTRDLTGAQRSMAGYSLESNTHNGSVACRMMS